RCVSPLHHDLAGQRRSFAGRKRGRSNNVRCHCGSARSAGIGNGCLLRSLSKFAPRIALQMRTPGMNETAQIAGLLWLWHLGLALVPFSPVIWLGRRRVTWRLIVFLVFFLPFAIWFALMLSPLALGRKTLANLGGEPLFFAITVPMVVVLREL